MAMKIAPRWSRHTWKLLGIVLVLSFCMLISGAFVYLALRENARTELLQQASAAVKRSDWEEAATLLNQVLLRDPNSEEALGMLLTIAEETKDRNAVALLLTRLAALNPLDEKLLERSLQASNDVWRFQEVQRTLERVKATRAWNPDERLEAAIAALGQGNIAGAREIADGGDGVDAANDERLRKFRADMAFEEGDARKAGEEYRQLGENAVNPVIRTESLIRLAALEPDMAKRREILVQASAVMPRLALAALAEFDLNRKDFAKVIEDVETLPIDELAPAHLIAYGEAAAALKDTARLDKAIAANRAGNRAMLSCRFYLEAMRAFQQGNYADVLRSLEGASDYQDRILYKYFQFVALAQLDPANPVLIDLGRTLGNINPLGVDEVANTLLQAANRLVDTKHYTDAARVLACVDTLKPDVDAIEDLELECLKRSNGMLKEQQILADRILRRRPENLLALEIAGTRDFLQNDWAGGVKKFEVLHRLKPETPRVLITLAEVAELKKDPASAEALYREGLAYPGIRFDHYRKLWGFYMRQGRPEAAEKLLADLKAAAETDAELMNVYLYCEAIDHERAGRYAEARNSLSRLREKQGNSPEIVLFMTQLAIEQEDKKTAEQDLRAGIAAYPQNDMLLAELAALLARSNRDQEAYDIYRKLAARHPEEWLLLINFSETAAALGKQKEAYDIAFQAKNRYPELPAVSECYAIRLAENGRYEDALAEIDNYSRRFGELNERLKECREKSMAEQERLDAELRSKTKNGENP